MFYGLLWLRTSLLFTINCLALVISVLQAQAQTAMITINDRHTTSLNGEWKVIIDPTGGGEWRQVWAEKKPQRKTDFIEYSFDEGPTLHVPGDFNTQLPELMYVEGGVWYKKTFTYQKNNSRRLFIYFGAVNYMAKVYLNGQYIGSHEGGFTPFQFELTQLVAEGENRLVVKADNGRREAGLPGLGYDWFNYGGITRDVSLVQTANTFIEDYSIQLQKGSLNKISGWVKLNGAAKKEKITVRISELNLSYSSITDDSGYAPIDVTAKIKLWSPADPKLYRVQIESASDTVDDEIGFRSIEVQGTQVLLNKKPLFFKGVDIHEERPFHPSKAYSEADALTLLTWAKELGCNFVRLVHYPHNENMVRTAEKMGLLVWDEIPAYQNIEFSAPGMQGKLDTMMREMMRRDRNRCAVVIWSLANETYSTTPNRTNALIQLSKSCRNLDSTRLITTVLSNQGYSNNTFTVWDTLVNSFDIISINEYAGWYAPWQGEPKDVKWKFTVQKPLMISEFGGEAKYGSHFGPADEADSWSEDYQAQIYKDQITLFGVTPNLVGVSPWLLVDYRSPVRMHPTKQNGFNRKGLLSEYGERKKAWYVLKTYYERM